MISRDAVEPMPGDGFKIKPFSALLDESQTRNTLACQYRLPMRDTRFVFPLRRLFRPVAIRPTVLRRRRP